MPILNIREKRNMKDIFYVSKLQYKLLYQSLWNFVYYIGTLLLSLFMLFVSQQFELKTLGFWIDSSIHINIYFILCCIAMGINVSHHDNELLSSLPIKPWRLVVGKLLALFLYALTILLIPFSIILLFAFNGAFGFLLAIHFMTYVVWTWSVTIIISATTGFFLGQLFKGKFVYMLAIPFTIMFSPYNRLIFDRIGFPLLTKLFNAAKENMGIIPVNIYGFSINHNFLIDKLFLIIISVLLLYISILMQQKSQIVESYMKLICINILFVLFIYGNTKAFMYTESTYLQEDSQVKEIEQDRQISANRFEVVQYNMDIDLKEGFGVNCNVVLQSNSDQNKAILKFMLDEALRIESLSIDNQAAVYRRQGNTVYIEKGNVVKNQPFNICFKYGGRLDYKDMDDRRVAFVDDDSAWLPMGFPWYPVIQGDTDEKAFAINMDGNNRIVSNLTKHVAKSGKNGLLLKGNCKHLYILSGFVKTLEIEGQKITAGEEIINRNLPRIKALINNPENKILKDRTILISSTVRYNAYTPMIHYDDFSIVDEIELFFN